jgi:putative FmdB family regulatory protein
VPTYDYHCDGCGRDFEVRQRISEAPLTTCDVCGGSIRRLISPAPFILKGEGWYVTDYPSASRKKAMESEKGGGDKGAGDKAATSTAKGGETSGAADKPASPAPSSPSGTTSAGSPPD